MISANIIISKNFKKCPMKFKFNRQEYLHLLAKLLGRKNLIKVIKKNSIPISAIHPQHGEVGVFLHTYDKLINNR